MWRTLSARLLYPLAERHQRRQIRDKARLVAEHMRLSLRERKPLIQAQLAASLERAGCDVPYYRDLFRLIGFNPTRIARDIDYLQDLPYLTKDIIREQGDRLLSQRFDRGQLHVRKTGGSTGPSTLIYYSAEALDWTAAVNVVSLDWAGKPRHAREAHLASRFPETFPWRDRLKETCKCLALNRQNIFTAAVDSAGLDRAWRRLRRVRPHVLQGHPSTVYALAVHLRERGINARHAIRVFESTGEVLDAKKRAAIESVFACRAIDRYGNAEFGVLAYEHIDSADQQLRVFDCIAWPEECRHENGTRELVFTALQNDAMPLIRYRTGDMADLECQEDGFHVRNIVGRMHDVVEIAGQRYLTHYLQDLLDRIGGIDEFQIEQRLHKPLLRLVVVDGEQRAVVAQRLAAWWGDAVEIEFTDFGGLTRGGWRSKFRYLVDSASPDSAGVDTNRAAA